MFCCYAFVCLVAVPLAIATEWVKKMMTYFLYLSVPAEKCKDLDKCGSYEKNLEPKGENCDIYEGEGPIRILAQV